MAVRRKTSLLERISSLDARTCDDALSQSERDEAEIELFGLWRNHDNDGNEWTSDAYRRLGSSFRRNDPLLAYEVFTSGLEQEPDSQALRYQQGLTLVRLGAHSRGLDAATLALLLGKTPVANRLAKEARAQAKAEAKASGSSSHWQMATIAEASFVLGEMKQAEENYREAVRIAGRRFDDIGSMRRNARHLAKHFGKSGDWVEDVLRIPAVVVFTGHMVDQPGRDRPRFPARIEKKVAERIEKEVSKLNAGFGFSSAACGSDILFLEAMLKRGHIHIVLPFAVDEFVKTSVAVSDDDRWTSRFERVMQRAEDVHVSSGAPSEWGGIVFEYASLLLLGMAQLRSRALDTDLVGLAVWDHNPGDGPGGTGETVKLWRRRGIKVVEIDTQPLLGRANGR